jgi:hypothetical protein
MKTEKWKPIVDFPDYAVSSYGRVKRIAISETNRHRYKPGLILKPWKSWNGYIRLAISNKYGKKQFGVHQLVLRAFVGRCPKGKECSHKDGNKENNKLDNLEWATRSENRQRDIKLGLYPLGSNHHMAARTGDKHPMVKLKADEVWLIRKCLAQKISQRIIALMFKCHRCTINRINCGRSWKITK